MNKFIRGRYSVGMENEAATAPEDNTTADAGAGAENLETDLIDVNDSDAEGSEREAGIDDAADVIDEMEEDKADIAAAQESGGLDKAAAGILQRKINIRLASIGMSPIRMPSMESFGSASGRQGASVVAMEAITDKVKDVWSAIVAAIKKAAKWIRDHFVKVFGAQEKLKKRAIALQERSGNVSGKVKNQSFENDRVFNGLAVSGRVDASKFNDFYTISEQTYKNIGGSVGSIDTLVNSLTDAEKLKNASADVSKAVNIIAAHVTEAGGNIAKENQIDGATVQQSKELPGGVVILTATSSENVYSNRVWLAQANPKAAKVEGRALKTLSTSDCETVAQNVEKIADTAIANRKNIDKFSDMKDKLASQVERLTKTIEAVDDKGNPDTAKTQDNRSAANDLRRNVIAIDKIVGNFPARFVSYTVNVGKNLLDYVELSLKQYEAN